MSSSDAREYVFSPRAVPISLYYSRQLSGSIDEKKTNSNPKQKPKPKNSLETPQLAPKKTHSCCVIL
jgi:hypothetical protein